MRNSKGILGKQAAPLLRAAQLDRASEGGRFAPRIRAEKMFGNQEKGGMEGSKDGADGRGPEEMGGHLETASRTTTIHRFDRRVFLLPP